MLVLTRKQQEKIQIGDNITITILRTKGKTVRIGIEAPGTVPVLRGELAAREKSGDEPATSPRTEPVRQASSEYATAAREDRQPAAEWQASRPDSETSSTGTKVSLDRVPKSRVATVLPKLLGADSMATGGPLRAMLDRRVAAPNART